MPARGNVDILESPATKAVDFERQVEQAKDLPIADELKLIITGNLDAAATMKAAKLHALALVKRKLARALWAEHQKQNVGSMLFMGADGDPDQLLDSAAAGE